jgi:hypothetical protein
MFDLETTHTLLTRNWFLDEEAVENVLMSADQTAWDYVYEHRHTYATRIRQLIEPMDYVTSSDKLRTKIREFTDDEWKRVLRADEDALELDFSTKWNEASKTVETRPQSFADLELENVKKQVEELKARLARYMSARSRVSSRDTASSLEHQEESERAIKKLHMVCSKIQATIDEQNTHYMNQKKKEFRLQWLLS